MYTKEKHLNIEKTPEIRHFERNKRTCDENILYLSSNRHKGIHVVGYQKQRMKMKEMPIATAVSSTAKSTRTTPKETEEMERLLSICTEKQTEKKSGITFLTVKEKALSIYIYMKTLNGNSPNPAEVASLSARSGWFSSFKHLYNFQSLQLLG